MNKIDAMGKQCPIPLVMLKKSISENGKGQYEISVDNKIAVENIEKLCKQSKYDFKYLKNADAFICSIGVDEIAKESAHESEIQTELVHDKLNDVYIFDSNVLGDGDDKLGAILIKGFIFTLSQEDHVPKTIICYNSGVKLVCGDSESVQDFKELANKGVDIIACGTCLDYYNLKDCIKVGRIGNMYDIVSTINAATKVVRP